MNSKYVSPFPTLNFPSLSSDNSDNLIYEACHDEMCSWLDSEREDEFLNKPHINIYSGADIFSGQNLDKLHSETPLAQFDETKKISSGTNHYEEAGSIILANHPYILYAAPSLGCKIPIGFTQFSILIQYFEFDKSIRVGCLLDKIYVADVYKGQHVGAALVLATSEVIQRHCSEVISQCKLMPTSCPSVGGTELYIYAELHSEGGESMVHLLNSQLDVFMDDYNDEHQGETIRIKEVELDAGF